ncbi:efflux RND transporter periplasmic adaptor subunit [Bacteroides sp.]
MSKVVNLVLAFGFVPLLASCGSSGKEKEQELRVEVAKVTRMQGEGSKEFSFISKPFRTTELSFRVGGPISRFDVYPGNSYRRGEVIAEIDPRDFRINKERTEAVYNQAKAEFERIKVLYEKDNLSASSFEKAKADYALAKTAYEAACNALADTRLAAPFDGYVGEVYIEKFQDIKATQPVLSFIDVNQIKIEAYVTQDIAIDAQQMDSVRLCFDTNPGKEYRARVVEVSKGTTRNNLSYLLTAALPNPGGKLLAGMSGRVSFDVAGKSETGRIVIPQVALCHRPSEGDYVWVVDEKTGKLSRRKITVGSLLTDGVVTVVEGLQPGEAVAVSGLRFLSDGMTATIAERGEG